MKIRTRFTLLFTLIVGLMLSFFSFAIYYLSENYRQNDFHARLENRAIEKLELLLAENDESTAPWSKHIEKNDLHSIVKENITIYGADHQLLYSDNPELIHNRANIDAIVPNEIYSWTDKKMDGIGFIHIYKDRTYILFASAFDQHGSKYISNLKRTLMVRLFIIMLIMFLIGWLFAGYFLKPISNIVQQADKITHTNLSHRLKTDEVSDEIGKLTSTFNRMLERLETAFSIQKRFVANASHELRNPLTAISGLIDVTLMKDRSNDEYKETLQSVSTRIKDLSTLTNDLLELANSNVETLFQNFDEVRVDEILWDARERLLKQKPDCNIHIHFEDVADNELYLTCKGKAKLLETAFINIMDNACKFSDDNTVKITVVTDRRNIVIAFTDHGVGMPETYLTHVFEPFFRASNVHGVSGKGIGLSLVRGIVNMHLGKIFIRSKLNEGTTVEVVLPNLAYHKS